jgi:hypothetical protein
VSSCNRCAELDQETTLLKRKVADLELTLTTAVAVKDLYGQKLTAACENQARYLAQAESATERVRELTQLNRKLADQLERMIPIASSYRRLKRGFNCEDDVDEARAVLASSRQALPLGQLDNLGGGQVCAGHPHWRTGEGAGDCHLSPGQVRGARRQGVGRGL